MKKISSKRVKNILCLAGFIILLFSILGLLNNNTFEGFEASSSNFNQNVASGKKLVWFYADWCGHCKTMHDSWDKAADKVNTGDNHMIKVNIGNSKDDNHTAISNKYGINSFPTILLLENGNKVKEYNNKRTTNGFIKFCEDNGLTI